MLTSCAMLFTYHPSVNPNQLYWQMTHHKLLPRRPSCGSIERQSTSEFVILFFSAEIKCVAPEWNSLNSYLCNNNSRLMSHGSSDRAGPRIYYVHT